MGDSGIDRSKTSAHPLPKPLQGEVWPKVVKSLRLAPQHARIIELIVLGRENKEIAKELGLGVPTVRTYLNRTYERTRVEGRVQLIVRIFEMAHEFHATERGRSG